MQAHYQAEIKYIKSRQDFVCGEDKIKNLQNLNEQLKKKNERLKLENEKVKFQLRQVAKFKRVDLK